MTNTPGMITINGSVLLDGENMHGAIVLILSANMEQLVAATSTGLDGNYGIKISPAEPAKSVVLVVKIQGPILAMEQRLLEPGQFSNQQDFNIDTSSGDFCTLQGEIIADQPEKPSFVEITVTPAHLSGISPAIEKFFLRRDIGIVDASYYEEKVSGNNFELRVQKGSYRISGSNITYKRPVSTFPVMHSFIVDRIFADDEKTPLPGEQFGGFTLDLNNDRKIKMHLKILSDDTSSPQP